MDPIGIILIILGILLTISFLLSAIATISFCFVLSIQIIIGTLRVVKWIIFLPNQLICGHKETEWNDSLINEYTALLRHLDNLDNRANQFNPNNRRFWQSRGYSSRPDTWEDEIAQRNLTGQLEYLANCEASTSRDDRRKMGRDNKRVEKVVKEIFGGQTKVYRGVKK